MDNASLSPLKMNKINREVYLSLKKQKKITLKFKRHLEKVLKRPSTQQPYQTTMHGIHDWFDHYNAALFENKLPNFDDIKYVINGCGQFCDTSLNSSALNDILLNAYVSIRLYLIATTK